MAPSLYVDDLALSYINNKNTSFENLKIGDIIAFKASDPVEQNKIIVSRVTLISDKGDEPSGNKTFDILCDQMLLPKINNTGKVISTKRRANDCSTLKVDFLASQKNYVGSCNHSFHQRE